MRPALQRIPGQLPGHGREPRRVLGTVSGVEPVPEPHFVSQPPLQPFQHDMRKRRCATRGHCSPLPIGTALERGLGSRRVRASMRLRFRGTVLDRLVRRGGRHSGAVPRLLRAVGRVPKRRVLRVPSVQTTSLSLCEHQACRESGVVHQVVTDRNALFLFVLLPPKNRISFFL